MTIGAHGRSRVPRQSRLAQRGFSAKGVPIWNFHGTADEVEPVATSRVMIEALRRAGGRPRHTEYAGVGHDVFMWAYTEPALVEWLFAQKRWPRPNGIRAMRYD